MVWRLLIAAGVALGLVGGSARADDTLQLPTKSGDRVIVKDFTKLPSNIVSPWNADEIYIDANNQQAEKKAYDLIFNTVHRNFRVILLSAPLDQARDLAQQYLIGQLGFQKGQMCSLQYVVRVSRTFPDNPYGAKNLKFSFCPGAVNLNSPVHAAEGGEPEECAKGSTPSARFVCANPDLARLDEEVWASFQKRLRDLPPKEREQLIEEQASWVMARNKRCKLTGKTDEKPQKPCMVQAMQERLAVLSPGNQGARSDRDGGRLSAEAGPSAGESVSPAPQTQIGTRPTTTAGATAMGAPAPAQAQDAALASPFSKVRANVSCQADGIPGFSGPVILTIVDPASIDQLIFVDDQELTAFLDHMKAWSTSYCFNQIRSGEISGNVRSAHIIVVGVMTANGWSARFEAWDVDGLVLETNPHFTSQ